MLAVLCNVPSNCFFVEFDHKNEIICTLLGINRIFFENLLKFKNVCGIIDT